MPFINTMVLGPSQCSCCGNTGYYIIDGLCDKCREEYIKMQEDDYDPWDD